MQQCLLAGMGQDEIALPIPVIQNRELTITGVFRYGDTWPAAIRLTAARHADLASLVTAHFDLDYTAAALDADQAPGALRAIV